jgi:hypothetical protein
MDNLGKIGRSLMDNWGKIRQLINILFCGYQRWLVGSNVGWLDLTLVGWI